MQFQLITYMKCILFFLFVVFFLQEMKPELSYLAHHTNSIDKYREETCCVIG